jgi:hypothetical protein
MEAVDADHQMEDYNKSYYRDDLGEALGKLCGKELPRDTDLDQWRAVVRNLSDEVQKD